VPPFPDALTCGGNDEDRSPDKPPIPNARLIFRIQPIVSKHFYKMSRSGQPLHAFALDHPSPTVRPRRHNPRNQSPNATVALPSISTPEPTKMIPSGLACGHAPSTMIGTPFEQATGRPSSDRVCLRKNTCSAYWLAKRYSSIADEIANSVNFGSSTKLPETAAVFVTRATWADPLDLNVLEVFISIPLLQATRNRSAPHHALRRLASAVHQNCAGTSNWPQRHDKRLTR
jgi:hypothetical protein